MAKRPTLAELTDRGHENNFNLIRLAAALAVIVSHSFPLTVSGDEPLVRLTGNHSIGEVAVDIFFLTSGFLVTKSLLLRRDALEFIIARMLRIYPGLIVMVILTVGVAGLFSPPGFFVDPGTLHYVAVTAFIWFRALDYFHLPGFFDSNPWPGAVNGSLHTLPFELRMYGILLFIWFAALLGGRARSAIVGGCVLSLALSGLVMHMILPGGQLSRYIFMFFSGASYFVLRKRIRLHGPLAIACTLAIGASVVSRPLFPVIYSLLLGYVLFTLSYLPRLWRPRSDISFGTYIYAFPVQQCVAMLFPGILWYQMLGLATPVVLLLALASWHLIEKPSIGLKKALHRWRAKPTVIASAAPTRGWQRSAASADEEHAS